MIPALARANCRRMSAASTPPIRKKTKPAAMYIKPSFLWSTDIVQRVADSQKLSGFIVSSVECGDIVVIGARNSFSLQGHEVIGDRVELIRRELEAGHVA